MSAPRHHPLAPPPFTPTPTTIHITPSRLPFDTPHHPNIIPPLPTPSPPPPPPTPQTDAYLEELTDTVAEADTTTQTDAFLDRPPTPLFVPQKSGVDAATQIEQGEAAGRG